MIENMERIKEEVKKRLRSMGKHGDFEIEEVGGIFSRSIFCLLALYPT